MTEEEVIKTIINKFSNANKAKIPLLRGNRYFLAELIESGIKVDNLGKEPFLPWGVFIETVKLLEKLGGTAKKGNAMNYKLGEKELDENTIEGCIASKIYSKKNGDTVFRRITPIANILIWAGICKNLPGKLELTYKN